MANLIGVVGKPGTGKSTSLRTLDHKETCIVSPVKKALPFKGSRSIYNEENKNYLESDNWQKIIAYCKHVSEKQPKIKNLILDDIGLVMSSEFMNRASESGWVPRINPFNCWNILKAYILQRKYEIELSVKV